MDRQPVVEGKTRVTVAEVGGGCVLLQLSSECRERAPFGFGMTTLASPCAWTGKRT